MLFLFFNIVSFFDREVAAFAERKTQSLPQIKGRSSIQNHSTNRGSTPKRGVGSIPNDLINR